VLLGDPGQRANLRTTLGGSLVEVPICNRLLIELLFIPLGLNDQVREKFDGAIAPQNTAADVKREERGGDIAWLSLRNLRVGWPVSKPAFALVECHGQLSLFLLKIAQKILGD